MGMTATEELRRLLDERGVKWDKGAFPNETCTYWRDFFARPWDKQRLYVAALITPEQAVEATLGPGTCRVEYVWDMTDEYEYAPHVYYTVGLTCGHSFEQGDSEPPNFCPECGRKVVGDGED